MRIIALDTETTGLDINLNHAVIEIGAVEIVNRKITSNYYHQYINPKREVGDSFKIHGISDKHLEDKPFFYEIMSNFLSFIGDSPLVIHNAKFDLGFLNNEIKKANKKDFFIDKDREIIDTMITAKKKKIKKVNLDYLCNVYGVDNSERAYHGALKDAKLLAQVYLKMTGGQINLINKNNTKEKISINNNDKKNRLSLYELKVIMANKNENAIHKSFFENQ